MYYLDIETVYILLKIESTNQCHTEYIRNSIVGKNCPTCKLQYIQQTFSPVWSFVAYQKRNYSEEGEWKKEFLF